MQQDDTGVLTIGITANVAQNLRGIRVASGGVSAQTFQSIQW